MNTPNNNFDEGREMAITRFSQALDELGKYLNIEITDKMKSKNLKFFDLMFTHKPNLSELDSFLEKHGYYLNKNCEYSNVHFYLEEIKDDIQDAEILFAPHMGTDRYILVKETSIFKNAIKKFKESLGGSLEPQKEN